MPQADTKAEQWPIVMDLMDCVAAGRPNGDESKCFMPVGLAASPDLSREYKSWVRFYRSWFKERHYPLAQAFLNTKRGRVLVPPYFLYGTAVIVRYKRWDSLRLLHLMNSTRFLYFFTQPEWTRAMLRQYRRTTEIDDVWETIKAHSYEIRLELEQLASKYATLAEETRNLRDGAPWDWTELHKRKELRLHTSKELKQFIVFWKELVDQYSESVMEINSGAIDAHSVLGQFLLLDFFDVAYLLQLRYSRDRVKDWVKKAAARARDEGSFLLDLNAADQETRELLVPQWGAGEVIQSVVAFPIASQPFGEANADDDVFFIGFLKETADREKAVPELSGLRSIVNLMSSASLNELRQLFVVDEARHSTVAAIMGRNMSHNIGSHVLHWMAKAERQTTGEERLTAIPRANFLTYLRERMDYIATVTKRIAWWYATGSADSLISPFMDIASDQYRPPLSSLLGNICTSDSVRSVRIAVKGSDRRKRFRKLNVAIPCGAAGRQAFYTIIENTLRNTAKYQQEHIATSKDLVVKVDFDEPEDYPDLVEVSINDSGITPFSEATVDRIMTALRDPFTKSDGEPTMSQLGYKEMRISAAFLRGIDPWRADEVQFPDLIQLQNRDGVLTHVFYLRKSRDLLLLTELADQVPVEAQRTLKRLGVGLAKPCEVGDQRESGAEFAAYKFHYYADGGSTPATGGSENWPVRTLCSWDSEFRSYIHGAEKEASERIRGLVEMLSDLGDGKTTRSVAQDLKNAVYDAWLESLHGDGSMPRIALFDQDCKWLKSKQVEAPSKFFVEANPRLNPFREGSHTPPPEFKDPTAVFSYHGVVSKMWPALSGALFYIERFSAGSAMFQFLSQDFGDEGLTVSEAPGRVADLLVRELRETALARILIIDERLAEETGRLAKDAQEELYCLGMEVLGAEFLQLVTSAGSSEGAIEVELPEDRWPPHWRERTPRFTYLTIHYSIIEKVAKKVGWEVEICARNLLDCLRRKAIFVFVHSGRGRPEVPEGIRFVDYSSLALWFSEGKRSLVNGLGGV